MHYLEDNAPRKISAQHINKVNMGNVKFVTGNYHRGPWYANFDNFDSFVLRH